MGLTKSSTGIFSLDRGFIVDRNSPDDTVVALSGNPNVGKSTVFNALTGMNQHTGNWPGKTVSNAFGTVKYQGKNYTLVDIPGTYSLMAQSAEEEVARNYICFGEPDVTVVLCDATCLERNLNLVLQTIEITKNVVVAVNLMDEAAKKGIKIDIQRLSECLGVDVIPCTARKSSGIYKILSSVDNIKSGAKICSPPTVRYLKPIEKALQKLTPIISNRLKKNLNPRWIAIKMLDPEIKLCSMIAEYLDYNLCEDVEFSDTLNEIKEELAKENLVGERLRDAIVACIVLRAEEICSEVVSFTEKSYLLRDQQIDKFLTSRSTGIPMMLLLLAFVFWLTISGANYPSQLLSRLLFGFQDYLTEFCELIGIPVWIHGILVMGVYRTLAWVVSVMLPPMAIFFPLFTLLEDVGYLPRIAFNLDHYFKKAGACGKQALSMCMGFGCNAAGVVGCKIIDSPRERLIAIITNNFVPCNGRFPTLIAIIMMFFVGVNTTVFPQLLSAVFLTGVILLGVFMTFLASKLLSLTILKGIPSSFTLELPPYRRPQIGKTIVRSIFDRTLFVLGRAMSVAAPAGLVIWILANISVDNISLLAKISSFLDPFGHILGMDGVILLAFILGFPANEIVIPIIIMTYLCTNSILDIENLTELKTLLVANGWTSVTAVCTMLFSLMHWPCSTTCLTIQKETGSFKWTAVSILIPTIFGVVICFLVASTARIFGVL